MTKNKVVLLIAAVILAVCSIGMQTPEYPETWHNIFSIISGLIAVLFVPAILPKIDEKYLAIIKKLMEVLAMLLPLKKKKELTNINKDLKDAEKK